MNNRRNSARPGRVIRCAFAALCAAASMALPAPALADDLGRLFFTPQERQELDRRRASNIADRGEAPAPESLVTVNGRVTRSGGKTTTWINGVAQDDTYRSRDPAQIGLQGRSVKVGETLDRSRGAVTDPLQGGEIRINPAPAR